MTTPSAGSTGAASHEAIDIHVENQIPDDVVVPNEHGPESFRESFAHLTRLQDWVFSNIRTWDSNSEPTLVFVETPTSSGKTLAVGGGIFDTTRNEYGTGLFLYPFRALAHDQRVQLKEIRSALDVDAERVTTFLGGDDPELFVAAMADRDHLLTTPDKLAYLLAATGGRTAAAGATQLLTRSRFVMLDEVHTYTGMMLWHTIYLFKAWIRLADASPDVSLPTVFVVTATLPSHVKSLFERQLGDTFDIVETNPSHRVSLGGDWDVAIEPTRLTPTLAANRANTGTVTIFDTAWEALQAREEVLETGLEADNARLYIGQDKQPAGDRMASLEALAARPETIAFFASRAAEAGVDYDTSRLQTGTRATHPSTPASSLIQRVGRAGRAGDGGPRDKPDPAEIRIHSPELWTHFRDSTGTMSRSSFEDEIRTALPKTDPNLDRPYYGFAAVPWWALVERSLGADSLSDGLIPAHQDVLEELDPDPASPDVFFRAFIPFARYESGETISYRSLFRTALPIEVDPYPTVTGQPNPHRFYEASVPHGTAYADRPAGAKTNVKQPDVEWKRGVEAGGETYLLLYGTFDFRRQRRNWREKTMLWYTPAPDPAPAVEFKLALGKDRRYPAGFVDEWFWTLITEEDDR